MHILPSSQTQPVQSVWDIISNEKTHTTYAHLTFLTDAASTICLGHHLQWKDTHHICTSYLPHRHSQYSLSGTSSPKKRHTPHMHILPSSQTQPVQSVWDIISNEKTHTTYAHLTFLTDTASTVCLGHHLQWKDTHHICTSYLPHRHGGRCLCGTPPPMKKHTAYGLFPTRMVYLKHDI